MTGHEDLPARLQQLIEERDAALVRAEASRQRLAALQSTTVAVAGARSTAAAIDVVLGMGLQVAGADAGLVAVADQGVGVARIMAAVGPGTGTTGPPPEVPLDASTVGRIMADGRPLFARTPDLIPPDLAGPTGRGASPSYASLAALPLSSGTVTVGVLVLSFADPQPFDEHQVVGLSALANLAAAALLRVRLQDEEERARAEVAVLAERNAFLAEATAVVSAPLDERTVLERLARLCVPRLGDWCSITRPRGDMLERVIVHHHVPELAELASSLEHELLPVAGDTPMSRTYRTGVPQLLADLGAAMAQDPHFDANQREVFRRLGDAEGITVPIGPASRPVGVLAFAVGPERTISDDDVSLATEIALRAGIAVTHAENFARERDAAALLQRAILPATLPVVPGVELAAAYRPADLARTVGGDWYDACVLDDHRIAVAVGDVAGHGMAAAAAMGQLRNALRAYLFEGHTPGKALRLLNRLLSAERSRHYATVVVGVLDLDTGELVMANAGHLSPLLVGGGRQRAIGDGARGPMIGVFVDARYPEERVELAPDDLLVLFTDGLVERRRYSVDETVAELCRVVSRAQPMAGALQAWCDDLVRQQGAARDHDDDSCVLVLRTGGDFPSASREAEAPAEPEPAPPLLTLDLEPQAGSARVVRRWLDTVLVGHPRLEEVQLCATELVTNAVIHARTPFSVTVCGPDDGVRVAVRDASRAVPQRQPRQLTSPSGRGLHLLDALATRWGVEPASDGKVVWFELLP